MAAAIRDAGDEAEALTVDVTDGRAQLEDHIAPSIPMGRWGRGEEIADAIVFLAADRSSFMTGQAFVVDGGESI